MRFQVLGPLDVTGPDGSVRVTGRGRRALLAMLLLHAGRPLTLPALVDGIWAESPPRSAVANIRTYVCDIRRLLRRAGDSPARLASISVGYRLDVGPDELDLLRFRQLQADGWRAVRRRDPDRAADRFGHALRLWRGHALEDVTGLGPAVAAHLVSLDEQHWAIAASWIDARLALGDHHELIPVLRRMVAERPLHEQTRGQLMTALHVAGRTADALAAFREARRMAIEELGVEPGPDLQQVHAAILSGEPLPAWRFGAATLDRGTVLTGFPVRTTAAPGPGPAQAAVYSPCMPPYQHRAIEWPAGGHGGVTGHSPVPR
jgi:DNA-binding SARP family transcriptional activator